jgi:hypothetical protein
LQDSEKKPKKETKVEKMEEAAVSPRLSRIDSLTKNKESDIVMYRQLNENSSNSADPGDPPANPYVPQVKSKSMPQRAGSPMPLGTSLGLSRSLDVDNDDENDNGLVAKPRQLHPLDGGSRFTLLFTS